MRIRVGCVPVVFLVVLLQASSATGQDTPKPEPAKAATSDPYAAESLVVEHQNTVYRYAADGTGSRQLIGVYRMQSEAAARQFGVLNIPFAGNSEHVVFDYIRVRKPDGTLVETPVSDAIEMPQEVTRQAPFYSDLKEKQVPVRNLRAGDKLEYSATIVRTAAEAPGEFWGETDFGHGVVVLDSVVELHLPKAKYVQVWSPEHNPTITETATEKTYRWTGSQLKPTIAEKGKDDKKEKEAKPEEKPVDREGELDPIAWTTFKSWAAVGAWYRALEGTRMVADASVKAKVAELTAGKSTEDEKAHVIYDFVSTQIRYIGVALGVGRYQPHPAEEVLRNQYGDCKDKHTLLTAMLGAAGIHADASLIGEGIRMNVDVPSPGAFNHVITALRANGKTTWIDATTEVAPYRVLISPVRDKQTLVVPATGVATLERTPADLPFPSVNTFTAIGDLSAQGTVNTHMEYITRGDDELVMRALFAQVAPGQWDELAQGISRQLGFSGTTSHIEASRPYATAEPERIAYDYTREKLGDWDNYRIVPLFPVVFLPAIDEKDPPKEEIELGEPRIDTAKTVLKLPPGWGVELPSPIHQKTTFATFDKTYAIAGETLTIERRIQVLERRLPAAQWKSYKSWLDKTVYDSEPFISLTRAGEPEHTAAGDTTTRGGNNSEAARLVKEAYDEIHRGEVNKAENTLNEAKALNPSQQALWITYSYLHSERREWYEAERFARKELSVHPENYEAYRFLAQIQLRQGDFPGALESMRTLVKDKPKDEAAAKVLAGMLVENREFKEASAVYATLLTENPDDPDLQIRLGMALVNQQDAAETSRGATMLVAALDKETDPALMNEGAYALANHSVELGTAEKSAHKAIDQIQTEVAGLKQDTLDKTAKQKESVLFALWDTLGWTLFQQGHAQDAVGYIRAAWLNSIHPESGLHLGEIEEKLGHREAALAVYDMALSTRGAKSRPSQAPNRIGTDLKAHADALRKAGVKSTVKNAPVSITQQGTLPIGQHDGPNVFADYTFAFSEGKIVGMHRDDPAKSIPAGGEAMLKSAALTEWTPPGSIAKIVRQGSFNCHSGVCELVIYPF